MDIKRELKRIAEEVVTGEDGTIEILRVLCGSRAYGLHDDDSDFDYHGVFVVPTRRLLEIRMDGSKPKETRWIEGSKEDDVAWEIGHFLRLAVRCNPTVLETFVAPVIPTPPEHVSTTRKPSVGRGIATLATGLGVAHSPYGEVLRGLLGAVVSRKRVYESYSGYAHNQRKKMFEPTGGVRAGERKDKFAVAYCRALWQGEILLRHGRLRLEINTAEEGKFKKFLKRIKADDYKTSEVIDVAEALEARLTTAYLSSTMQEEPDLEAVNEFLVTVREAFW